MLTPWQRLSRMAGAYINGFLVVGGTTTPFDLDFQAILIKAGFGGCVSCLFQVYRQCEEYGRERKQK